MVKDSGCCCSDIHHNQQYASHETPSLLLGLVDPLYVEMWCELLSHVLCHFKGNIGGRDRDLESPYLDMASECVSHRLLDIFGRLNSADPFPRKQELGS